MLRTRLMNKQKLMYCNLPLMWGWLKLLYPRLTLSGSLLYAYNQTENYRRSGGNSIPALDLSLIFHCGIGDAFANKHAKNTSFRQHCWDIAKRCKMVLVRLRMRYLR